MKQLNELTILETLEGLKSRKFTSTEITKACLAKIKELDDQIKAFITVTEDSALVQAASADKLISEQKEKAFEKYPLLGIPYALKDNFCTKGILTTASSNILRNFIPPYESTVSQRLKDAGAVLLGKTNMDAFAHGSSTETSDFFTTKNPHDLTRLPGGSSGGSAAAVAAHMCIFALGSETAGSIRQPANWCGVVGLKPTYGRVSRYGLISMMSSTDCPGPLTKSVYDAAYVLKVISVKDEFDATCSSEPLKDYVGATSKEDTKLRVGFAPSYFVEGLEAGVKNKIEEAITVIKKLGYSVEEVDLMDPKYSIAVYTIAQRSEVSSNLARFDGIRYGFTREEFGFEAKKRQMLGAYTLSAGYYDKYYTKAQKVRTLIIQNFEEAFKKVDVIVGPISPSVALKIGAFNESAMFGELQDILVEPSAMAGLSAISVPCGTVDNMPVGLGIMSNRFNEDKVLALAASYEHAVKEK